VRWIDQVLDIALEHPLTPLASQPGVATPEVSELPVETAHESADDNATTRTH
jgi:hypothetical protein